MALIEKRVTENSDDALIRREHAVAGCVGTADSVNPTHITAQVNDQSEAEHGVYGNYCYGSVARFLDITIPKGATVSSAYLKIVARSDSAVDTLNTCIHGEASDNPITFSDEADYNGRGRTIASVNWDAIAHWTAEAEYTSPDIKAIIVELVNREGWVSGNAIVIFWDDDFGTSTHTASRIGYSHDSDPDKAPQLVITYTIPAVGRSFGYIIG